MGEGLILESSFLIDLEREERHGKLGPATEFLRGQGQRRLYTTFTATGEIAAGTLPEKRSAWESFMASFEVLPWSPDVTWQYGQTYQYLKEVGLLIGANDLWIAATALAYEMPLVTRDRRHFARVPGLSVRSYRDS